MAEGGPFLLMSTTLEYDPSSRYKPAVTVAFGAGDAGEIEIDIIVGDKLGASWWYSVSVIVTPP